MMLRYLIFILATLLLPLEVRADSVTMKDGSVINGTITLVDEGTVHIETSYAGKLKIKQENIVSIESASPLEFRLKDGTLLCGTVVPKDTATLLIQGEKETKEISPDQIAATWTPGEIDPEVDRNMRKWQNNLAIDLIGRTGNVERYNFGAQLDLRLKGPYDEIYFGFDYEEGEENGNQTADREFGQARYERFNKRKVGWFINTILETDPINGISLRSNTNNGISYRLINNERQTLIIRGGPGYRYTEYENSDLENESTATIDPGLSHTYKYKDLFYIENRVDYSPSIEDFSVYTAVHDSSIQIPIKVGERFLIRIGVRNRYESQTSADEKLDTNYYTQVVYSWK